MAGRILGFCSSLLLNIAVAVIGTAVLDTSIRRASHPQSAIRVEYFLSVIFAALIGYFATKTWLRHSAKWTWFLPLLWFGVGLFVTATQQSSVLGQGNFWDKFSGAGCAQAVPEGCRAFFGFTVPLMRTVSYSFGAGFVSLKRSMESSPVSKTVPN